MNSSNEDEEKDEKIYSKQLKVLVKSSEKEERCLLLTVSAELQSSAESLYRKELIVHLTEEDDPLFYYHLKLNDEDYQSLRLQQGLLVDFASFPQKFVDLLELSRFEESKESPRFVLHFVLSSSNGLPVLNIVETNPFKHLVHLSLKFVPGTDSEVKIYLSSCLKKLKASTEKLKRHLSSTELDLNGRLRETREQLALRASEAEKLKLELREQAHSLHERLDGQLSKEKDRLIQIQRELQDRYERDSKELEYSHSKTVQKLESSITSLDLQIKDLTENRYKLECTVQELRNRVSVAEDEARHAVQESQGLRRENIRLESLRLDLERSNEQLSSKLTMVEQELRGKEVQLVKIESVLQTCQEQKTRLSEDVELKQSLLHKREVAIKSLSDDLNKGNEIIRKLQAEIKNLHLKLKLRNKVTQEQEKVVKDRETKAETLQHDVDVLKEKLLQRENEVKQISESLTGVQAKLEDQQKILKTNENVINWLNKQLNESQVNQQRAVGLGMTSVPQNLQYGSPASPFTTSTPATVNSGSSPNEPVHPRPLVHYNANHPVVQVGGLKPNFSVIPEEPVATTSATVSNKENNLPLSERYLQPQNSGPKRGASNLYARPPMASGARLPRTSIAPLVSKRAADHRPSAYFPS